MTAIQFILIIIAAIILIVGLFKVNRSLNRRQNADAAVINYDKNGIPIIPRHERNIIDQSDFDDTVAGETTITPNRDYLNAVIEEGPAHDRFISNDEHNAKASADFARWQAEQQQGDGFSGSMPTSDDILPVIDTVEDPVFIDNSPILDQHLLEPVDDAQNGPLINAKDNINITILPHQYQDRPPSIIRGQDLLGLVDKYGLRFGAMNMFHRYENTDGSGILWCSMMGITEQGIAPFDPHNVATDTYNGVVLFLSLPHPRALVSFDGMMSIAYMMANDLDAVILDESNEPITADYKQQLRNEVRDYQG